MRVWRIARGCYAPLDGEGARLNGGRWNSAGRPVVYTAQTAALAVLEVLVWTDPEDVPDDLRLFEIELPDGAAAEQVSAAGLPRSWMEPGSPECAAAGDRWLAAAESLALAVPSAVLPEERNLLINPRHPDAARVRVAESRPFAFDLRLLR
ncbi:MAG TPA: RES family NAD+ phosphorylase [Longimicrobium sp.]|nr:RES family NAD+ phosphorylase [Longimicrobium sp.]